MAGTGLAWLALAASTERHWASPCAPILGLHFLFCFGPMELAIRTRSFPEAAGVLRVGTGSSLTAFFFWVRTLDLIAAACRTHAPAAATRQQQPREPAAPTPVQPPRTRSPRTFTAATRQRHPRAPATPTHRQHPRAPAAPTYVRPAERAREDSAVRKSPVAEVWLRFQNNQSNPMKEGWSRYKRGIGSQGEPAQSPGACPPEFQKNFRLLRMSSVRVGLEQPTFGRCGDWSLPLLEFKAGEKGKQTAGSEWESTVWK